MSEELAYYKGTLDGLGDASIIPIIGLADGRRYWPVRMVCERLGVNSNGQLEKLRHDGDYAPHLRDDFKLPTQQGMRTAIWIEEEALGGWISSIQSQRVKPEMQERIKAFRKSVMLIATAILNRTLHPVPPQALIAPKRQKMTNEEVQDYMVYLEKRLLNAVTHTPIPAYVEDTADLDGGEAGIVRVPVICPHCGKPMTMKLRLRAAIAPEVVDIEDHD